MAAYGESTRHYHTLLHLEECLVELDRVLAVVQQPAAVEIALWFHDAVYDSHSSKNEEDSAAAAVECLEMANIAPPTIELVRQFVLSTKTHEPVPTADGPLLIDIDLAILGQPSARFWDYEHAIRAEYAWMPATVFAEKRVEILQRFLQRPAIYRTAMFRARYESNARTNLAAAIGRLRNPSG